MTRPIHSRGFTLLELLVSVLLFVLLVGVVHQSLRAVGRAAEAAGNVAADGERLRGVTGFIERHLSGAMPVLLVEAGRARLLFEGDAERLVFVTLLPPLAGYSGPSEVVLETPPAGRDTLWLAYRPLDAQGADRFGMGEYRTHALGAEVSELRFSYYGASEPRAAPAWHERWRDDRRPPALVRVSIRSPDGSTWPDIVVRLRTDSGPVLRHKVALEDARPRSLVAAMPFGAVSGMPL